MELFLQFGYGMMDHSRTLIKEWGRGTVILSPRDLNADQLQKLANDMRKLGGSVLLDPQFYLPYADHERLRSHAYWPFSYQSNGFWTSREVATFVSELLLLNRRLGCRRFILPGVLASAVDDDWIARQEVVVTEANALDTSGIALIATVALSEAATRNDDQIHMILDAADRWEVDGVYLVCEHPKGDYLVGDPKWLANVLDLTAGFRLRGKSVIIGYCNQQMLIAASASATAIASGTWMNVRSFPPEKFRISYDDEIKQRTTWYYCPSALSEYKVSFLDIASDLGVLSLMAPPGRLNAGYADILFTAPQPSLAGFTEQTAFRHYLECLHRQVAEARKLTFDDTIAAHGQLLDDAEQLLRKLYNVGVRGQHRDFREIVDANRAALNVLRNNRGAMLRRNWEHL